jgi:hypothetical protein
MYRIAALAGIGVVLACSGSSPILAQGAAAASNSKDHSSAPRLEAAAIQSDIHLDGKLDEASWAAAQPASLGIQRDPDEGKPATEQTDIRVVIGSDALYIGARMFDREPARIVSRLGRRDDFITGDRLTIRLDARHDHLTAFVFDIYPAGNKGDASMGSDEFEDNSWDPVWDVATSIDSLGWVAEIRIPFSQLRYDRNTTDWGIQIVRFIQRKQEEDVFSYIPKEENGGVNRYGHLGGMGSLPASRRIEITPYASARAEYTPGQGGNPFRDGSDYFGGAGADLRLGITSNLTLDATINPDFGQVEVDPAVVNLSPFETPFDEKRPFFIEGSDLFRFGSIRTFNSFGTPETFFSRRIGRSPQGFVSDPNATFVDMPGQTTIAGAAKVTGKTRSGWSLAALDAVTPEEQGHYVTGPGSPVLDQPVEPFTNYFVGRVRRELRQGNTVIGGIVTAVNRRLEDSVLSANLRSNAYLAGVDLNHSWGGRNWAFDASFATSRIEGSDNAIDRAQRSSARFFQRPDANNLNYDPTRNSLSGYALQTAVTKLGGGHWGGNLAYQEKSPGYETNDIGFEQVTGRRGVSTDIHYFEPRAGGILRNYTIGFLTGNDWNYDGDHTTKYFGTIVNSRFRNFWSLNSNFFYNLRAYDDQLTRGGPQAVQPANANLNLFINSDDRGAWSVGTNGRFNWDDAGGRSSSVGLSVSYQPAPNIRFRFEPNYSRVHSIAQFVRGVSDPTATATFGRRSVFATLDQNELALNTRLEWTFTSRMSLQLFMQPLVSAGDFTDYKELARPRTFRFDQYGKDIGTIQQDPTTGDFTVDPDGVAGPAAAFSFPEQNFNFRSIRANLVFRWEYRPGSTIFLVWQQERSGQVPMGDFSLRRDLGAIFDYPATNLLAVKVTYWLGL